MNYDEALKPIIYCMVEKDNKISDLEAKIRVLADENIDLKCGNYSSTNKDVLTISEGHYKDISTKSSQASAWADCASEYLEKNNNLNIELKDKIKCCQTWEKFYFELLSMKDDFKERSDKAFIKCEQINDKLKSKLDIATKALERIAMGEYGDRKSIISEIAQKALEEFRRME